MTTLLAPMKPYRLYALFRTGYELTPDEHRAVVQYLLQVGHFDNRLFESHESFARMQAERGISRSS